MAISYPVNLPSGEGLGTAQLMFSGEAARGVNENKRTLKTQIFEHSGKKFRAQIAWNRIAPENAKKVRAFLLIMLNADATVLIGDPANKTPGGAAVGLPKTKGSSNAIGNTQLITKGWTAGTSNILKAGDDISVENFLYTNLVDVDADGSGDATLEIFPPLRSAPAADTTITTDTPKGKFRLETFKVMWSTNAEKVYDISATFVEAV